MSSAAERDEQVAWERRRAPLAAAGAIAGAVLPMAAAVWLTRLTADDPSTELTGRLLYIDDHTGELIASTAIQALGALALALPLWFLYRATAFRRPVPRAAGPLAIAAPLLYGLGLLAFQVGLSGQADAFAASAGRTYEEAKDLFEAPGMMAIRYAVLVAQLALGVTFVLVSLNAMRAGLLTRFMGYLGVIVGALFVIPLLGAGPPVVQSFWLAAMAAQFLGRWPGGVPPAWREGREIPWPSRQEMIEQAQREREAAPPRDPEPATAGAAPPARERSTPARKRKRKKRR